MSSPEPPGPPGLDSRTPRRWPGTLVAILEIVTVMDAPRGCGSCGTSGSAVGQSPQVTVPPGVAATAGAAGAGTVRSRVTAATLTSRRIDVLRFVRSARHASRPIRDAGDHDRSAGAGRRYR